MVQIMKNFTKKSDGQVLIEYGLFIGVFVLILVGTVPALRNSVTAVFAQTQEDFYKPVGEVDPAEDPEPGEGEDPTGGSWFPPQLTLDDEAAVYANGDIILRGSSTIYGYVVTNGGLITTGKAGVEGPVSTYTGYAYNFPLPVFPDIQGSDFTDKGDYLAPWWPPVTEPISEDAYYHNFTIQNEVTIDTGEEGDVRTIVVDNFNTGGTGDIHITGNGKLIVVINETFDFNGDSSFNLGGLPEDAMVYYRGTEAFNFGGDQDFAGYIYLEQSDLYLRGSTSNAGNIIVGGDDVKVVGDSTVIGLAGSLLYAPKAKLVMTGSSSITGKIVANSVELSGDASITFEPVRISENFYWDPFVSS